MPSSVRGTKMEYPLAVHSVCCHPCVRGNCYPKLLRLPDVRMCRSSSVVESQPTGIINPDAPQLVITDGKVEAYRTKIRVSFKYEGNE
jgi:hypothetical protein